MEKKALRKLTKHHVFMIIYGVIALSAVAVFWIFKDNPIATIYDMAVLWLALPVGSMIISYSMTAERGPKGLLWLLPLAFGAVMCAVEFLTLSLAQIVEGGTKMPSIALLFIGAFASLVGFTFAKQDRVEKERAERAKRKKEAKAAAKTDKKLDKEKDAIDAVEEKAPETVVHEDDYNPGADFIPDENDTWADEVLEREGYGKEQVEYATSDTDFSIDMSEEAAAPADADATEAEFAPAEETESAPVEAEEITEPDDEVKSETSEASEPETEPAESSEDSEIDDTPEANESGEAATPTEEETAKEPVAEDVESTSEEDLTDDVLG